MTDTIEMKTPPSTNGITFLDVKKRKWNVLITIGSLRRLKTETGIDILNFDYNESNPGEESILTKLYLDTDFITTVLASLLGPQLKETGITEDDLFDALDGESMGQAKMVLMEGLVNFFRMCGRGHVANVMTKMESAVHSMQDMAVSRIDKELTTEKMESFLDEAVSRNLTSGLKSSAAPESPA